MAYIKSENKKKSLYSYPKNVSGLNFLINHSIHSYIKDKGLCYQTLNEVVGVLECAKASFIQTVLTPNENKKIKEIGNINELDKEYLEYQQTILEDFGEK